MCSSHRPENGADSNTEPWNPVQYRVFVELFDGDRVPVTVKAIGPNDAKGQAWETAKERGLDPMAIVRVESVA